MQFRATLASVMTVILLSISSAASKCEIKCEFATAVQSCHGGGVQAQAHEQMAGMPGMAPKASPEQGKQTTALVATAPSCKAHACAQPPALFSEQKAVAAHVSLSTEAVFSSPLLFVPEPAMAGFSSRGPPNLQLATPITLHTTHQV